MSKRLRRIAETPFTELRERDVKHLARLEGEELEVVIKHANKQKPPNTEMMAAAGVLAAAHLVDVGSNPWMEGGMDDVAAVEKAFPAVTVDKLMPREMHGDGL